MANQGTADDGSAARRVVNENEHLAVGEGFLCGHKRKLCPAICGSELAKFHG